jgi:hypothetical protein
LSTPPGDRFAFLKVDSAIIDAAVAPPAASGSQPGPGDLPVTSAIATKANRVRAPAIAAVVNPARNGRLND